MDNLMVKTHPISSKSLIGIGVKNNLGEELGEIKEILVDPENGYVVNLIMETGNFIGFKKRIDIPWDMLKFDGENVLMNIEKDFIERIPAYDEK